MANYHLKLELGAEKREEEIQFILTDEQEKLVRENGEEWRAIYLNMEIQKWVQSQVKFKCTEITEQST